MIRVNLLRSTGLSASTSAMSSGGGNVSSVDQQKMGGVKLVVILLFPILLYAYEYSNISSLKSQLASVQAESLKITAKKAAFGDTAPRVEKYTKQKAKIDSQMAVIGKFTKNRLREVKALDSLQEITPPQVWFETISMSGGLVRAKGYSLTDEGLTALFTKLTNSAIFSRFEPKSQSYQNAANGSRVLKFDVEFHVGRQDQE